MRLRLLTLTLSLGLLVTSSASQAQIAPGFGGGNPAGQPHVAPAPSVNAPAPQQPHFGGPAGLPPPPPVTHSPPVTPHVVAPTPSGNEWRRHFETPARRQPTIDAAQPPRISAPPPVTAEAPRVRPPRHTQPQRHRRPPPRVYYDPPIWGAPPVYYETEPGYYPPERLYNDTRCVLRKRKYLEYGRWVRRWVRVCP